MRTAFLSWSLPALLGACVIDEVETTDVGDKPWCEAVATWPTGDIDDEQQLRAMIGQLRRQGVTCGDQRFYPTSELVDSPQLRCAARNQASWLVDHSELPHTGEDGTTALSRANLAGYDGLLRYELLASEYVTPSEVLSALLEDPTHCAALLDRRLADVGVGRSHGGKHDPITWVVLLGQKS